MKTINFLFLAFFLFSYMGISAQTYYFSSPQGYAAGTTGGGSGPVTIVTTKAQLQTALLASGNGVVIVQGSVQCDYLSVLVTNKTLLGLPGAKLYTNDQTAGASGILYIKPGSNNVIIRNLIFVGPGAYDSDGRDCLTNEGTNVWVDHCEFQDGMDGNFDNKGKGDNITVTWCKFTYLKAPKAGGSGGTDDHRFSNLVGSSSSDYPSDKKYSITWQYCWWAEGCRERMVRARNAQLHMLNCFWNSSVANKCLGLEDGSNGGGTQVYLEGGVFETPSSTKNIDVSYGGSPDVTVIDCIGSNLANNSSTVSKPSYTYTALSSSQVKASVTSSCGAGATLNVTTSGAISTSCGTSNVAVTGVSIAPTSVSLNVGGTSQLTATIAPSNATNKTVSWSSSNTSVATVSSSGLVTAVAAGFATITVTTADGAKTATCSVTATAASCTPTAIVPYIQINGGSWSQTSTATVSSGATVKFGPQPVSGGSWSWSGLASGTSREVTIYPTTSGTATVTYTNTSGCSSTQVFTITVSGSSTVSVTGVTMSPTSSTITTANGTVQLTATVAPSNATNKNVIWTSNNTSVATVSSTGIVTGIANGSATITVTTQDGSKTATSAITVNIGTSSQIVHNFTVSGTSSSYYNISGNLSTTKGTVTYSGLTLTQCLKIESATSISFTAAQAGALTLVFNSNFNGAIKVDGTTSANASSGVLTISLAAGNHTLTKSVSANLYYMSYGTALKSANDASEIAEINSDLKFNLYPNPVISIVTIEFKKDLAEDALIQLFDNTGRLIVNKEVKGVKQTLDITDLRSGLYTIKVSNSNEIITKRIVKQ